MKLAEVGQPNAQKSGNKWARASDKRIMPALPKYGGRLQVAMFAAHAATSSWLDEPRLAELKSRLEEIAKMLLWADQRLEKGKV